MSPQDRVCLRNEVLKPAQVRGCEREQDEGTCETLEEAALAVSAPVSAQQELAQRSSAFPAVKAPLKHALAQQQKCDISVHLNRQTACKLGILIF